MTMTRLFSLALLGTGLAHFGLLGVSFQVPSRLGWREDLVGLRPLNRKMLWTYAGFTVLTIIAFGLLTLVLRAELVAGDKAALGLAAFIGCYWLARVCIDGWFGHDDWPPGRRYLVAHALLLTLFAVFAATYLGLVAWHLLWG
jgi:hypothetical protein